MSRTDAIIAVATAAGRGGVGILRLSGKGLAPLAAQLRGGKAATPRHAHYQDFAQADGSLIDSGLLLYFPAPHSYTGEDVIELQIHGGPVVLQLLQAHCLQLASSLNVPMRQARAGEFTERAYLNGKLDLAQAESVADLIDASSSAAALAASQSLSGAFSKQMQGFLERLINLRMLVEATLDFPEEDIDFLEAAGAKAKLQALITQLQALLAQSRQGALLRDGVKVVLVGAPNAGKSSLLNALAGQEVAIVTPIAGTTRDSISQAITLDGVPLHIVDTAGLRDTTDEVERIGIARSWAQVQAADIVLHVIDASAQVDLSRELTQAMPTGAAYLTFINKIDLQTKPQVQAGQEHHTARREGDTLYGSATAQLGLDLLKTALLKKAGWRHGSEGVFSARARHIDALKQGLQHLQLAQAHIHSANAPLDLLAEELRLAQECVNAVTGEFTSDDLLGVIFSQFCIGK